MIEIIGALQMIACVSLNQCLVTNNSFERNAIESGYNESKIVLRESRSSEYDISDYLRSNIVTKLENDYPSCTWSSNYKSTGSASGQIPKNIGGNDFNSDNIDWALNILDLPSSYGGCGPIAMIGIVDYLYNCLGYDEIVQNSVDPNYQKSISYDVLSHVQTLTFGPSGDTWSFPAFMVNGFNSLMNEYGLSNIISASASNFLPLFQTQKWNTIVNNINSGLPVTLMVGLPYEIGRPCDEHCCNIVGYETFHGYNASTGFSVDKDYLVVRLNFSQDTLYYCDADVLNLPFVTLITYDINYSNNISIQANNFSNDFVNNDGGGQYFFYNIDKTVWITDTYRINTSRLRCSYIEDEYLVLSPKREGAGTSYLEINTIHKIQKMTFNSALWSENEGHSGLTFKIQFKENDIWVDRIEIDPLWMSKSKYFLRTYTVLFPKNTNQFRFYVTHNNPTGNYNRGRTVLDNINFYYNHVS